MLSKNWTWQAQEFTWTPQFAGGRVIGHSFHMNANISRETGYGLFAKTLPASYDHFVCGFAFQAGQMPSLGGTANIFRFWNDTGGTILTIGVSQTGRIQILNSSGTMIAQSALGLWTANAWHFIEIKVVINGASSTVELYLNNAQVITSTTVSLGTVPVSEIGPYATVGNGSTDWVWDPTGDADNNLYYDDLYLLDTLTSPNNNFLGDCHVETVFPKAAGNYTQWTPLSGTNWSNVDDKAGTYPDDDTTHVYTHTLNAIDSYDMDDLAIISGTVLGLQTNVYARKYDALLRQLKTIVRQGGTDYLNANPHTLAVGWIDGTDIYDQDPSTSAAWTVAGVNSAEFGQKLVT